VGHEGKFSLLVARALSGHLPASEVLIHF
jgi:hypothetical protein